MASTKEFTSPKPRAAGKRTTGTQLVAGKVPDVQPVEASSTQQGANTTSAKVQRSQTSGSANVAGPQGVQVPIISPRNTQSGAAQPMRPGHSLPGIEARSTLIMRPGETPGLPSTPTPQKSYGAHPYDAKRTLLMTPDNAVDPRQTADMEKAAMHPLLENAEPPEIELIQHEIPSDIQPDSRLILVNNPDSERAAAFRVLRHHVMERERPRIIAVSGPNDGCGKTTTAVNLALAFAEGGRAPTLLVDANLRKPRIANMFRFVPPWCFAAQLQQHRDQPFLPWGFVEMPSLFLHIAAIDPRSERYPRLDSLAFAIAMDRLRLAEYEHIIIDCPSVLGNADVNLIQDATDGVLLTARKGVATTRDIRHAVDQMTPTKIVGSVLFE